MKRKVCFGVTLIFIAMFGYLFGKFLPTLIQYIKNLDIGSYPLDELILVSYIAVSLCSAIGLLVSLITLGMLLANKTKFLDQYGSVLFNSIVLCYTLTEIISGIFYAVEYDFTEIFKSEAMIRVFIMFALGLVLTFAVSVRKQSIVRTGVIAVSILGILVINVINMVNIDFSFNALKYFPETSHIYLFIILAGIFGGAMMLWPNDEE